MFVGQPKQFGEDQAHFVFREGFFARVMEYVGDWTRQGGG